jgi:hypothetical protein
MASKKLVKAICTSISTNVIASLMMSVRILVNIHDSQKRSKCFGNSVLVITIASLFNIGDCAFSGKKLLQHHFSLLTEIVEKDLVDLMVAFFKIFKLVGILNILPNLERNLVGTVARFVINVKYGLLLMISISRSKNLLVIAHMDDLPTELLTKILGLLEPCDWFTILVTSKRLLEVYEYWGYYFNECSGKFMFDPSRNNDFYLRKAAEKGYLYAVRYLIQDPRCDSATKK